MDKVIYAIGDVHGRDDLLRDLHARIRDVHQRMHAGRDAELIHLGDDIDGGAHSRDVIDRLMSGVDGFQVTCLLGNHEAMLLECLTTDNRQAWYTWRSNGGDETLASFGINAPVVGLIAVSYLLSCHFSEKEERLVASSDWLNRSELA